MILKFLFLLMFSSLCADWDPEYCLSEYDTSVLNDPVFQDLKQTMVQQLAGSPWCSPAKIYLLMDLVYVTKPEVCVEVGVYIGATILPVATTLKYLQSGMIFAVDAWSNAIAIQNMDWDDPNRSGWGSVDLETAYLAFLKKLSSRSLNSFCTVLRCPADTAVLFVEDEIDFLHLDGDHTEKSSLQDVALYLPKVKKGGYILLSNLFIMVKGKALKMKAFSQLFNACEMICEVDRDNTVLFRKN